MESGMLVKLGGRGGGNDRLLFACHAAVFPFVILMTTVSCSKPDMPPPAPGILDQWFSGSLSDPANTQSVQPDEELPRVQRERPKTSASRKVAVVHGPKQTKTSAARPVAKKASTPPSKKASTPPRTDAQREQQLFQEFLEWRKRQNNLL